MKFVSILDFDGTIVYEDVFEKLLDEFTKEDWKYYDYLVERGELELEEAVKKQFNLISYVGKEKLLEASKKYLKLRNGFLDFSRFCDEMDIGLIIASAGLDFYINYFLNLYKINAKCYCMQIIEDNEGLKIIPPSFDKSRYKNFKEAIVQQYNEKGYFTIYIGDGFNDFLAARRAKLIFAVKGSVLEEKCSLANLNFNSFENFEEIKEEIIKILD